MTGYRMGYIPDLRDPRDLRWSALRPKGLERKFSLRSLIPFIFNQGQLGSCTANGIAMALIVDQLQQSESVAVPSRLGIYYGERLLENSVLSDAGAMIRDGMKVIAQTGYGLESDWPYDISRFAQPPPTAYFQNAAQRKAIEYRRVPVTTIGIKTAIAAGFPVVGGFAVHESFMSLSVEKTGKVPLPKRGERVVGGHCTLIVGWDDGAHTFEYLNSWSNAWGDQGFYTTPQSFARRYESDCWTCTRISV